MKEDRYILDGGRVVRSGSRTVPRYERDPTKIWLGSSQWYLDLATFSLTHDGEQIATDYSVDPSVLIHTDLVSFGEKTSEGRMVNAPTVTWFEVVSHLWADPQFRYEFCNFPEKLEHFLAAAHCLEGYNSVIVTPRSGDKGRDVIAVQNSERLLHEAKAYNPTRVVEAEQVRALYGVLKLDAAATNAVITTTADFAPRAADEFCSVSDVLQMVSGAGLVDNIQRIAATQSSKDICTNLFAAAGIEIKLDQNGRPVLQRKLLSWEQLRQLRT